MASFQSTGSLPDPHLHFALGAWVVESAQKAQTELQRAKEILEREKERIENIINPLQENNFTATLTLSKKAQETYTN